MAIVNKVRNTTIVLRLTRFIVFFLYLLQFSLDAVSADGRFSDEIGGNFKLTDQNGDDFELKQLQGNFVLLFFGYTSCPDICPLELSTIARVLTQFEDRKVKGIFVSVDPERDTLARLKQYIPYFHPRIVGLTGTQAEIRKVADQYKVQYSRHGEGTNYTIDHSSQIFVIGPQGKIRSIAPFGSTHTHLVEVIMQQIGGS